MVTVVTPTYNRAYILPKLYESLCTQTNHSFDWLIIDDGSTDDTQVLVKKWIDEKKVTINYIFQENFGKSAAINTALLQPLKKYFFIVDSDDYLTDDAIESICRDDSEIEKIKPSFLVAGLCYRKKNYNTNTVLSTSDIPLPQFASSLELAFKYKQTGDKAEVFLSEVIKQFPFPTLKNNKFVTEAVVWFRIANKGYKFFIKDKAIYFCDYLEDGYTKNSVKLVQENPRGFAIWYRECLGYPELSLFTKFKYFIRYLQCILFILKKECVK